jgi:hypothetical protein
MTPKCQKIKYDESAGISQEASMVCFYQVISLLPSHQTVPRTSHKTGFGGNP